MSEARSVSAATTGAQNGAVSAYEAIREAIVEGRYPPGQRLIEQRLADAHALSRTPVREALKQLHAEGLVEIHPNRGAVVRLVTLQDIEDLYELRAELESYAARRAATRITETGLLEIAEAIADFDLAIPGASEGDLAGLRTVSDANRRIHDAVVSGADHSRLAHMLHRTVDMPLVFQAFRRFGLTELQRSNQFHRLLLNALESRDPTRASGLMAEHIYQGRDALLESMSNAPDDLADELGWVP